MASLCFDNATKNVYALRVHMEVALRKVSVREARENLKSLIDQAAAGEEIILLRRGREVARLVPPKGSPRKLPSLETFRASIHPQDKPLSSEVISGREKERY